MDYVIEVRLTPEMQERIAHLSEQVRWLQCQLDNVKAQLSSGKP
jgi:predicted DNA-binding protein